MFSSIEGQFSLPTNSLYALRDERLKKGQPVFDMISGNVNTQGIHFPAKILSAALAKGIRQAKDYRPDPLGQRAARQAISRHYADRGCVIPPGHLVLTPGTSISYWYAFKLLANPGEEILSPSPSYPLFDSIASLCGVNLVSYRLRERSRWEIDFDHLEAAITPKTKAIILISPHNPTGTVASEAEIRVLARIASSKNLAVICDEVFSPFLFQADHLPMPAMTSAPLVLTLNGFSKMLALPGMKIGWIALTGNPALVEKSLKTLEMISDTFLPVNEAAQWAVPQLLEASRAFQKSYVAEIRKRKEAAAALFSGSQKISFVQPEGGFFLTLRLEDKSADEENVAFDLLKKHGILLHPGYFYDMEDQHLILSFVGERPFLGKAIKAILAETA